MGINTPGLNIGVSLGNGLSAEASAEKIWEWVDFSGVPQTRWKLLQTSGRLGRSHGESAIFITVAAERGLPRGLYYGSNLFWQNVPEQPKVNFCSFSSIATGEGGIQPCQNLQEFIWELFFIFDLLTCPPQNWLFDAKITFGHHLGANCFRWNFQSQIILLFYIQNLNSTFPHTFLISSKEPDRL